MPNTLAYDSMETILVVKSLIVQNLAYFVEVILTRAQCYKTFTSVIYKCS
jgi:hypothetical protein